jgi:hypothetical protein
MYYQHTRLTLCSLVLAWIVQPAGKAASTENFETTTVGQLPSTPTWLYDGPTTAGSVVDDGTGNRVVEITDQGLQRYSVPVGSRSFLATSIDIRATADGSWMGQRFTGNDSWQALTSYEYLRPPYTGAGVQFPAMASGRAWIDNLSIDVVSPADFADGRRQQFEANLPSLASYDFTAPQGRHNAIQGTIARLQAGENLEMLMLGDSIVGDTMSSVFFAKAGTHYPGSITANLQIRGSTGVQYYQDPSQLQAYVLDHSFDILFVGGISNLNNGTPTLDAAEAALRSVLDQVLAERPTIDVILSAEMAGDLSAGYGPNTSYAEAYDPFADADWRSRLYEVAGDYSNIAVIDTWKWYDAIGQSGLQYSDFMRDAVHMNFNGHLLAGEVLGEWLSPNNFAIVPEPSGFAMGGAAVAIALVLGRRATKAKC